MKRLIDIPVIDISPLAGNNFEEKVSIAEKINTACHTSGFFYAANHGINLHLLQETTSRFHSVMPDSEKLRLAINAYNPSNTRIRNGYYMAIQDKKANESYCYLNPLFADDHPKIRAKTPMHEVNIWPCETICPGLRNFYESYYWEVFHLSLLLLRGFSIALGKDEYFFETHFKKSDTLSAVSLIRYPYLQEYPPAKMSSDGTRLSFGEHQDVSLITVLYQTPVPNLQVEMDDGYCNIPVSGEHFLVNCGTYMSYITNGYYPAPVHRVAFINEERLSIPFFANLSYDSKIEPFSPHQLQKARTSNTALPYGQYLENGLRKLIITNGQT